MRERKRERVRKRGDEAIDGLVKKETTHFQCEPKLSLRGVTGDFIVFPILDCL